jgi:SAM-dependent methyltransferase
MARQIWLLVGLAAGVAAGAGVVVYRHAAGGRHVPGGILVGDPRGYDRLSHRILLGSFFRGIAADVGSRAARGDRVLEVGCGPGHLSIRLVRERGLDVTGVDLDPQMIDIARSNASSAGSGETVAPTFVVGDAADLPFADESFDLVVSTLSMHHWSDLTAGLAEIGRVLRPGGRVLIWDLRAGVVPMHRDIPDPLTHLDETGLRIDRAAPWAWPWRLKLTQRMELSLAPPNGA